MNALSLFIMYYADTFFSLICLYQTLSVSGCWACMQMKLNGPVFDADKWGDFTICQQMKADRLSSQK